MNFAKLKKCHFLAKKSTFFDLHFLHLVKIDFRLQFRPKIKSDNTLVFSVKFRLFWWVWKLTNLIFEGARVA